MNPNDARALALAINAVQPYCPPILFAQIANNPACLLVQAIANEQATIEVKPRLVEQAKAEGA